MKPAIVYLLLFTMLAASCSNPSPKDISNMSEDSIKQEILRVNDAMIAAIGKGSATPEQYAAFCEDSVLLFDQQTFFTSAYELSHDLAGGASVPPHDYTIRIYKNTAILSYLTTSWELIHTDTVFHNIRILKTFVLDNGAWKMAAMSLNPQMQNYFKPAAKQPTSFDGMTGIYDWGNNKLDSLFVRDGKLYDQFLNQEPEYNFAVDDSTFMIANDLGRINFTRDEKGVINGYTYTQYDGQKFRVPKIK